jgi:nitroreductase
LTKQKQAGSMDSVNITEAISARRSIRKFLPKKIDQSIIEKIITAGILAPSAKNRQPWKFIIITEKNKNEMIKTIQAGIENEKSGGGLLKNFREFIPFAENSVRIMEEAPVTVFVLNTENTTALSQTAEEKLFEMANIQSIGAAIENMLLAALEYGIGSLWICDIYFAYNELSRWLNTDRQIVAAVSFGYPDESPPPRPRKGMDVLTGWK